MKCALLVILFILYSTFTFAQTREVTGRVLSEGRQPLAGATVKLAGSGALTHTGSGGRFKLSVPGATGKLQVSYIGYKPVEVPGQTH